MDRTNAGFIDKWKVAGPALEEVLTEDLRRVDVPAAMESLSDAYESALLRHPRRCDSGLIHQQAWFAKGLAREKTPCCRQ